MALRTRDELMRLAAVLVIAGAVGNLGDRLMNGGVTDFILVRWFPFVFNVADVAITVGAVLLAARMLLADAPSGGAATPVQS
jgi:signal peptidase II